MATKAFTDRVMHGVSANSPLPPSVETAYYRKCIELKRRITEIEDNNDAQRLKKLRIERAILKMRLERAMLLEQIAEKMAEHNPDDSDESNSPPPTPQDRPLRSKRAHGHGDRARKTTPTPNATGAGGGVPNSSPLPPSTTGGPSHIPAETPDAVHQPVFREYVHSASNDTTPAPPVNGTGVQLPSLSSHLPPSIAQSPATPAQSAPSGFAAINNPLPEANGATASEAHISGAEDR